MNELHCECTMVTTVAHGDGSGHAAITFPVTLHHDQDQTWCRVGDPNVDLSQSLVDLHHCHYMNSLVAWWKLDTEMWRTHMEESLQDAVHDRGFWETRRQGNQAASWAGAAADVMHQTLKQLCQGLSLHKDIMQTPWWDRGKNLGWWDTTTGVPKSMHTVVIMSHLDPDGNMIHDGTLHCTVDMIVLVPYRGYDSLLTKGMQKMDVARNL